MTSRYTVSMLDKEGESVSFSIRGVTLTSGNIVAQVAAAAAVRAAVEDVSLLVTKSESLVAVENSYAPTLPTDPYAQRGIKFLVRGVDANGNPQSFHISGAHLSLAGLMDGENVDLASTEGAALVTALEAFWVSNAGEAVTVLEIVYVD
jgi:hypothetical protein